MVNKQGDSESGGETPAPAEVIPHPMLDTAQHAEAAKSLQEESVSAPTVGYYEKVEFVEGPIPRIEFTRRKGSPSPPAALREFRREISDIAQLIRLVFQKDRARRTQFFKELHAVAQSGAAGHDYSVDVGLDGLEELKARIAYEFPLVRGYVWWWNFAITAFMFAVCATASAAYYWHFGVWIPDFKTDKSAEVSLMFAAFLIPLGVAVGLFAEFVLRVGDNVTYSQLNEINPGRWKPVQRAINTILIACIFSAMLAKGVFHIGVAGTLLNDFWMEDPLVSVGVGFITGFSYPFVRDILQQVRPERREVKP
ncbi:hypothetical protein ACU8OJ_25375 (plasmid) [Rhizobium leguminosarum]